jgi:uncharacterized protein (DUF885 family)
VSVEELADDRWARVLRRDPETVARLGGEVDALPRGGAAAMADDVTAARHDLDRLAGADGLLAAYLADHLTQEVREEERFWYRFPVTPYNMLPLSTYRELIAGAEGERRRSLLDDYVGVVTELRTTLVEQRRRGVTLPHWTRDAVLDTVRGHAEADLPPGAEEPVAAAFAGLLDELTTQEPGTGVGIGQYPGGEECYAGLVSLHTGLDLAPDRIHAIGLEEVARVTDRIRTELGEVDEVAHRAALPAVSPGDVEALFQSHLDRLVPHLPAYFSVFPAAPFRLRRLDPAIEAGLTYGYYEPPGKDGCGYYRYNGTHPPVVQSATLIYHEGLPGHHMQIARQAENTALHPIRREPSNLRTFALNGYLEGWGEYAAGLCDEIGMYADPVDAYGRLCMERFQAGRLVVDTGMNVLGWTRERAGKYLRDTVFMPPDEIDSELLRYAVDDPGQALGYHLGHWYLRELRADRDPRDFHEAVLGEGPLPLGVLGDSLREH